MTSTRSPGEWFSGGGLTHLGPWYSEQVQRVSSSEVLFSTSSFYQGARSLISRAGAGVSSSEVLSPLPLFIRAWHHAGMAWLTEDDFDEEPG